MDKYTGKKLDGRYEINELIGVGGMAMVYRAYDVIDDRMVAIKILKDEFLNNADFIRRFKNESKAIAVMSHPNIVKVYDVSFGDMIQYIVMEYIDGITLKEYIAQQKDISWKEAIHFTVQILNALKHAHSKGIIHRDIKPQNIMLLQDGTIKVTDFGIARFSNKETRTMTERAIGSVHYIAPEQARGDVTDNKSDLYSVGVMLYEMLTGSLPFEADNAVSVAIMQLQSEPRPPRELNPDIPDGLEEITLKAMQKDPSKRYETSEEMLSDIELFRQNPSIKFEYKYFDDETPTKYLDAINNARSTSYEDNYNDMEEYEEVIEKKEKSSLFSVMIGAVTALLLVGIIFAVFSLFRSCSSNTAKDVDVPNLIGLNFKEEVQYNREKYNFSWSLQSEYNADKPEGEILRQSPEAGSKKIKSGSEIKLWVNTPLSNAIIPKINGLELQDALDLLEKNDFNLDKVNVIEVIDDNTAEGYVVSTYPKPGTEVQLSETIRLYVSAGPTGDQVAVPNLSGMTLLEVQNELKKWGLVFGGSSYEESTAQKDTVIYQNPLWGAMVSEGTSVTVTLSEGKDVTLSVDVPMPDGSYDVSYRVVVGSEVVRDITINTATFTENTIEISDKPDVSSKTVSVYLNGELYKEYTFDYKEQKVTVSKEFDFVPPVTDTTSSEDSWDETDEDAINNDPDFEDPTTSEEDGDW